MAMSKDRVRFQLGQYYFDHPTVRQLLHDAFSVYGEAYTEAKKKAQTHGYVVLICRPSQFARFLIMREQHGMQNMFKELKAELFIPAPPAVANEPVDVSVNAPRDGRIPV